MVAWSNSKAMREEAFFAYRNFVENKFKCKTFNIKKYEHGLTALQKSFMEAYLRKKGLLNQSY
jgi:hypothetical protein